MKLYTKGDRRYREAKDSEILLEAARVMDDLNMPEKSASFLGMADVLRSLENQSDTRRLELEVRQRRIMVPGEELKERKGVEPA